MATFPLDTTVRGPGRSVDEPTAPPVLGFALLQSASQPHRMGEFAPVPYGAELFVGRGDKEIEKFARFARRSPGVTLSPDPSDDLLTGGFSRRELAVCATPVALEVRSIGQSAMYVNGAETKRAAVQPGHAVMVGGGLLLLCIRRELELPLPGGFIPAFGEPDLARLVGESAAMWRLRRLLVKVARLGHHVLIGGQSGTGKELAARAIHLASDRANGPFIARNIANITPSLRHSELFGNIRNYPNPNTPAREGIVGLADGGTLFLDEIGECPLETQTALLRVLDSGEFERLGEGTSRHVNVRIVAATNRPESALKEDLVARFNSRVANPSLDDRREDIPLLVRHWLLAQARRVPAIAGPFIKTGPSGRPEPQVSARLIEHLVRRPLRLNIRELHVLLELALLASEGSDKVRLPMDLPTPEASAAAAAAAATAATEPAAPTTPAVGRKSKPPSYTKDEIEARFEGGRNITQAADALGMNRSTLRRRMVELGIKMKKGQDDT
jgi:DNA-binding NtrC family response regulator